MADINDYRAARTTFFKDLGMSYTKVRTRIEEAMEPEYADRVCVAVRAQSAQEIAESIRQYVTPILERVQHLADFENLMGLKYVVKTETNWSEIAIRLKLLMADVEEVTGLDQDIAGLLTQERKPDGEYKPRKWRNFLNHTLMQDIRAVLIKDLVSTLKSERRLYYGAGTTHYIEGNRSSYGAGLSFPTDLKEGDSPCQAYKQRYLAAQKYLRPTPL